MRLDAARFACRVSSIEFLRAPAPRAVSRVLALALPSTRRLGRDRLRTGPRSRAGALTGKKLGNDAARIFGRLSQRAPVHASGMPFVDVMSDERNFVGSRSLFDPPGAIWTIPVL